MQVQSDDAVMADFPPECRTALLMISKMWESPLSEMETQMCVRHMEDCPCCTEVFLDLQKLEMAAIDSEASLMATASLIEMP